MFELWICEVGEGPRERQLYRGYSIDEVYRQIDQAGDSGR